MPVLTFIDKAKIDITVPKAYLKGKRRLTPAEISVLTDNLNSSEDPEWKNVYVDDDRFGFDPTLIKNSTFCRTGKNMAGNAKISRSGTADRNL